MSESYIFFKYDKNWMMGRKIPLSAESSGLEILEVDVEGKELVIPSMVRSVPVVRFDRPKVKNRERVKRLVIPDCLQEFRISNNFFPALEKVEVDPNNLHYSTDGLSLYTKNKSWLLYALAGSSQKIFEVPAEVEWIRSGAFDYATCEEIRFLNPRVEVEEKAFFGAKWLDAFPDGLVIIGDLLYQVRKPVRVLNLESRGIRRIHPQAYEICKPARIIEKNKRQGKTTEKTKTPLENAHPGTGSTGSKAGRSGETETPEEQKSKEFKSKEFKSKEFKSKDLRSKEQKEQQAGKEKTEKEKTEKEKAGKERAGKERAGKERAKEKKPPVRKTAAQAQPKVVDGIIYSEDMETLVSYPDTVEGGMFVLPKSVRRVEKNAFAGQSKLEKLGLPETVEELGEGAFHQMTTLVQLRCLVGPRVFPSPRKGGYGVFEGCVNLSKVVLGNEVQEIGDRCFMECPLVDVILPPDLKRIGRDAFSDTRGSVSIPSTVESVGKGAFSRISYVEAYEGSARGLIDALFSGQEKERSFPQDCVSLSVHQKQGGVLYIPIPITMDQRQRGSLSRAWDESRLTLRTLARCFDHIEDTVEKRRYGLLMLSQFPYAEEMESINQAMSRIAHLIAQDYLEAGEEDELLELLRLHILEPGKASSLANQAKSLGLGGSATALREYSARETARRRGEWSN